MTKIFQGIYQMALKQMTLKHLMFAIPILKVITSTITTYHQYLQFIYGSEQCSLSGKCLRIPIFYMAMILIKHILHILIMPMPLIPETGQKRIEIGTIHCLVVVVTNITIIYLPASQYIAGDGRNSCRRTSSIDGENSFRSIFGLQIR